MKTQLIVSDDTNQENYPDAVIITTYDAYKIYDMKPGDKADLTGSFTKRAELLKDGYHFYHHENTQTILDENLVKLTINKFYYVGQKINYT